MPERNLNPDAPDSQVSKDQTIFAFETPDRDFPKHGSIMLKLHHSNFQASNWQITKATAESLRDQLNDLLALPAQPDTVNSVEEIPAKIQIISWEEEPEHECWKLAPDETFVGLIVKADRSWSPADQYTLNISRPVEG